MSAGRCRMRLPSISVRDRWLSSSLMMFCAWVMHPSQMCPVMPAMRTLVSCLSRPQNEHLISFFSMDGCRKAGLSNGWKALIRGERPAKIRRGPGGLRRGRPGSAGSAALGGALHGGLTCA